MTMDHSYPRITRRRFVAAASASVLSTYSFSKDDLSISSGASLRVRGLQLGWLSPDLEKDFDGTLRQIASIGYRDVEVDDTFGRSPQQLLACFDRFGLQCKSRLFSIDLGSKGIQAELAQQIEFAREMDLEYLGVIIPFPVKLPENLKGKDWRDKALTEVLDRLTLDDFKRLADLLNKIGAQTRAAGIQLAYHNLNTEFRRFDDVVAYDRLLEWTDPELVKMEMDTGWLVAGGGDPARYLRDNPGRFPLLHIKDVKEKDPNVTLRLEPVEVGGGIVTWAPLLVAARSAHVKFAYVEFEPDPPLARPLLQSAKMCLEYLKGLERTIGG
jgi:sugar phosphate isomerase/epimerase